MPEAEGALEFSLRAERQGEKIVTVAQVSLPCPACKARMDSGDISIGEFYPLTSKGQTRTAGILHKENQQLTCTNCSFVVGLPYAFAESLEIMGEAAVKVNRALHILPRISSN